MIIRPAGRAGTGSRLQHWVDRRRAISRPAAGITALLVVFLGVIPCMAAGDFGAAFLATGLGVRAQGMGGAFAAVVDDASAVFWNPAGLSRSRRADGLASVQKLSPDRKQYSLAASTNSRGGLGFGFALIYTGVDDLIARAGSGDKIGDIDNSAYAVFFGVGLPLIGDLSAGAAVKIIRQNLEVIPDFGASTGASTANGRAVDLGLQYRLGSTRAGAVLKNLAGQLDWTVRRSAQQSNKSTEDLPLTLTLGVAHQVTTSLLVAADVLTSNIDTYANAGVEFRISPMLSMRGGVHGMGGNGGAGGTAFGVTVRPMNKDTILFNYTFVDDVDVGSRTLAGLSLHF